eukprot:30802-Pelagococcus_subviridis.AAC.2
MRNVRGRVRSEGVARRRAASRSKPRGARAERNDGRGRSDKKKEKSSRDGVHRANAVVWGPAWRREDAPDPRWPPLESTRRTCATPRRTPRRTSAAGWRR